METADGDRLRIWTPTRFSFDRRTTVKATAVKAMAVKATAVRSKANVECLKT